MFNLCTEDAHGQAHPKIESMLSESCRVLTSGPEADCKAFCAAQQGIRCRIDGSKTDPHYSSLSILMQAAVFGNGSEVYGPRTLQCVSGSTVLANTTVAISPLTLPAGSQATLTVTPRVRSRSYAHCRYEFAEFIMKYTAKWLIEHYPNAEMHVGRTLYKIFIRANQSQALKWLAEQYQVLLSLRQAAKLTEGGLIKQAVKGPIDVPTASGQLICSLKSMPCCLSCLLPALDQDLSDHQDLMTALRSQKMETNGISQDG